MRLSILQRRKLLAELRLKEPIFFIMHDVNVNQFERLREKLSSYAESLHSLEEEIEWLKRYTGERLAALSDYLGSIQSNRQRRKLDFYSGYLKVLLRMHPGIKGSDDSAMMLFLYLYAELLLGSGRYLNIRNELMNKAKDSIKS